MSLINLLSFKSLGDERGLLVSLEANKEIPFDIERIYYIFKTTENVSRGFHAHKQLKQVAICVKGSCLFVLDDGDARESVILDDPNKGLVIEGGTWREMHEFSEDCVLLVIASECYQESDYIRNYDEFIKIVNG